MSKTFKSATSDIVLGVYQTAENRLGLKIGRYSIHLATSDAPALALAILEAAGGRDALGVDVSNAMIDLREYVTERERITAEAKDKAKLEAEALELRNTWNAKEWERVNEFSDLLEPVQKKWLAVARKAREMRAEK